MDLLQLVELGRFNPISTSRNIKFAKLKTLSKSRAVVSNSIVAIPCQCHTYLDYNCEYEGN